MKQQLAELFHRRYACHVFEPSRTIAASDLEFVLEAGRLSPSSFGLEHWKFMVVKSPELKQALQAACFQQTQVGTADAVIVILAKLADLHPDSPYIQKLLQREYPGDQLAQALANYRNFHSATDIRAWSVSQCHIAATNMMLAATAVGLDSCAIGGFLPDQVKQVLDIDPAQYEVALILPLGYCAETPHAKRRLPLADLVEYR
ncbi:MAG: NAD(P)H-dependent oxidoreductase [Hydrogenophilaceae bacterium]|nr:NAD(P)H-dependent oxidoreductase [Hydrogenophilaceae bacterium]